MKILKNLLPLAVLSVLLGSCASMQTTNPDNSLLLVMVERVSVSKNDLFVYYRLKGEGLSLNIDPLIKFQQFNSLKPGSYLVDKVQSMYIKTGKPGNLNGTRLPFVLEPNTVTVFPFKVVMILNKEGSVIKSQGYRFERLTTRDETECEEYIASQERYAGLAVRK